MSAADKTSESVKKTIVGLLNRVLKVEYTMIMNYPRIIDDLTTVNPNLDEGVSKRLRRLGEDSVRHANQVMHIIDELGGNPQSDIKISSKITDINRFFEGQMEKEKAALSLFQQAKSIIEPSQAKGIWGKLKATASPLPIDKEERSEIIRVLDQLAEDEKMHIMLLQNVFSALGIETQKDN